jgi:CubicO group peptidase (beta-lactamase class C family)
MKKLFFLLFLLTAISGISQEISTGSIDSLVEKTIASFRVPGIAVGVVKDGKIIHAKGYGFRSFKNRQPVTPNTQFGIASNSKAFTAAALGILVEQGKIKWEDHVRDYIPEFKLYDPYVTEHFTIKDLLTHRSGMGLGAGDLMFFPDSSDFTLKDIIYNLRFLPQVSEFRTKYDYDNNLYIVAGEVVARVSGISWDEFVEKNIFNPLGMGTTAGSYERLSSYQDVIDGHAPVNGEVQVIPRNTLRVGHAAGGIYSNINDLSKWLICLMNKGVSAEGKRILSDATVKEMWTPQTILPVYNPGVYNVHFNSYGLGFFLSDVLGKIQVTHTGGLEGMVTQITMLPELKLGIIVLTNQQEGYAFYTITNTIKDSYLGSKKIDWLQRLVKARKDELEEATKITDSVEAEIKKATTASTYDWKSFIGTYRDPWMGDVMILEKNGQPWLQMKRSPKLTGRMYPYKGTTMVVRWIDRSMDADAYVNFGLDEEGKGKSIRMKAISPLTDFSYDFHDLKFERVEKTK